MKFLEILDVKQEPIKMSKIILGGVIFGTTLSVEQSFQMMDEFVQQGGNTIDTARVYCEWIEGGKYASEQTIGEWVKARNNRNAINIITKGGHPRFNNFIVSRLSREDIFEDIDISLKTLQMDYVDLYLLHRDDVTRPVSDIMDTMNILVEQGKTRAIGVSNWSVKRILEANEYAKENGKVQFCVSEIQWSLAECFPKNFGDETLICMTQKEYEEYLEIGIPVIAYSSQANGVFAKAGDEGLEQLPDKLKKFVTPENIRRYNNLQRLCKKTGYSKTAVSLNYIIDNKLNAAAIIGCSKREQLQEALSTTGITLSMQEIDSLVK